MAIRSLVLFLLIVFADAVTLSMSEPNPFSLSSPAPAPWTDSISLNLGRHKFRILGPSTSREETVLLSSASSSSVVNWSGEAAVVTRSQASRPLHRKKVDKSVAGGGIILGGLGTIFLVAVFCYIRATRRHKVQTSNAAA